MLSKSNISVLNQSFSCSQLYYKVAMFYHCVFYLKLYDILDTVYGGYNGDYSTYLPPSGNLDELYIKIRYVFEKLDRRSDLATLQIADFTAFPNLYDHHIDRLSLWESMRSSFIEDKEKLRKNTPQPYVLADDVRVAFFDIDKEIEEHKKKRSLTIVIEESDSLRCGKLVLDLKKCELTYKNKNIIKITPTNQEIKLLIMLIEAKGNVVDYHSIATSLDLGSYRGEVALDVKEAIKQVKNKLSNLLEAIKAKDDLIENIMNKGYFLNPKRLQ